MNILFSDAIPTDYSTGALCSFEGSGLTPQSHALNEQTFQSITAFLKFKAFKSEFGQSLSVTPADCHSLRELIIVGGGKKTDLSHKSSWDLGGHICVALQKSAQSNMFVTLDDINSDTVAAVAAGLKLRYWTFQKYKTQKKPTAPEEIENVTIVCSDPIATAEAFKELSAIVEGAHLTRSLVSEPSNVLYPETLAQHAQILSKLGIKVDVFSESQLKDMGMHALIGVGAGSDKESKLVVMQWLGAEDKNEQPVAFVGKGVTFDSGGISIKPSKGMEDMKWDMGGAAVVVGLMRTLAERRAKVNVIGTIALAENMPSGSAQRPGDIVKSYSGQTIEVLNTDAEGRLVLADALWYTQEKYNPKFMINLATLTGAIIVTFGHEYAGLFSNDDTLVQRLKSASEATGEKVWQLPLDEVFDKEIDSPVADVKNLGNNGAGSITAAQFLQRFVNEVPWAHLDIAGVTWSEKDRVLSAKGATSFGVRLLNQLVKEHYEEQER